MTPLHVTILSCSLDPESRSRLLAEACHAWLRDNGWSADFLDLRDYPMPEFDNARIFADPNYATVKQAIRQSDAIVIASPVYNWGLSSTLKKLIESTGSRNPGDGSPAAWFDKIVTLVCAGGIHHSYMAYAPVAASLMMDFKCVVNPHIVYAVGEDFAGDSIANQAVANRIGKVMSVMTELTERLAGRTFVSARKEW